MLAALFHRLLELYGGQDRPQLILFTESLDIRFAVGIEEFASALLPRRTNELETTDAISENVR